MEYVRKQKKVTAIQFDGSNKDEVKEVMNDTSVISYKSDKLDVGGMLVLKGEYIVRMDNGEYEIMSRELFEDEYEPIVNEETFGMGKAIEILSKGGMIHRKGWNSKGLFVTKLNPDIGPYNRLSYDALNCIGSKSFVLHHACIIHNTNTGVSNSWVPSVSDLFAEDWMVYTGNEE